jgi:hypothetical protein
MAADRMVDDTSEESFPASDPPSTWSGEDERDLTEDGPEHSDEPS